MRAQSLPLLLTALLRSLSPAAASPPWDWARGSDPMPWPWGADDARSGSQLPVTVQCQEAQLVVTVHRDLFGTGRLVSAAELSLGPSACKHSGLDRARNTVTFSAGLHECGSTVQVTPDSLIYRTLLSYDPTPGSHPAIVRRDPAIIPIECHYPRRENVTSGAVRPTWAPLNSALAAEQQLLFSLRLMNEDWSADRALSGVRLGDVLHVQAEVGSHSHVPLRLFVDSCVAALGPGATSEPQYSVIDFHGCLLDGRWDDASSAFVSPRPRPDVLRFRLDAFRFSGVSKGMMYLRCHLKVAPAGDSPDPLHKACSYSRARNTWAPLEGTGDICGCCERGTCGDLREPRQRQRQRQRRHGDSAGVVAEADVVMGPVLLSSDSGGQRGQGHNRVAPAVTLGTALAWAVAVVAAVAAVAGAGLALGRCQTQRQETPNHQ